jgi:hypothetical protein
VDAYICATYNSRKKTEEPNSRDPAAAAQSLYLYHLDWQPQQGNNSVQYKNSTKFSDRREKPHW